ncbi:Ger(x)C family spore germination protein [Neobacillus drentensis]|uniref:Ger(x)C family spore germination protein n=1 Tax=Neobacillus drentensis TaxID=220684 RepID=UPI0030012E74
MKTLVKWRLIVISLSAVLLLNGCGFKDIDKRLFVVSIGVDKAKNSSKKYLVSLKFAIPGGKNKANDFFIVTEKADSMAEAVRAIKTKVDKEIDFSHAKVVVFSEEMVKLTDNAGVYYWLARRRDIQEIAWVAIGTPTAMDVLKVKPKSEQLPSNALFLSLGKDGSETPYIISEFYFDMKKRLIERGLDPFLPIIEAKKELLEVNSVGLFNKSKLILSLTQEETKILNHIMNRENKSALWVKTGNIKFIVSTTKIKTKYKIITLKGKQPCIKVSVKVKGNIEEMTAKITNEQLSRFEKAAEKRLKKQIKEVLVKIQKANVDPIGFGLRYRSRHFNNNDWEEWQRIYPHLAFKVDAKVEISDTGLIE